MPNLWRREQNTWPEKIKYLFSFLRCGIAVNIFTGNIRYISLHKKCLCEKVTLIRHGKTEAIEKKEFMSDTSFNSSLTAEGRKELAVTAELISQDYPDVVLVGPLERTKETWQVLSGFIQRDIKVEECCFIRGINNSCWAGKTFEMLDENNLFLFLQRECRHNIFVKTEGGDSWGDVLYRCIQIIKYLNKNYSGKKVLIISQGSIVQGLKMVLHCCAEPWEGYSAEKMFSIAKEVTNLEYGKLFEIVS